MIPVKFDEGDVIARPHSTNLKDRPHRFSLQPVGIHLVDDDGIPAGEVEKEHGVGVFSLNFTVWLSTTCTESISL